MCERSSRSFDERGLIEMRDSLKNVSVFAPLVAACRSSLATGSLVPQMVNIQS